MSTLTNSTDASNVQAALELAARGFPVFPLQPRSKEPYKGSRGFLDATTDPSVIREWWRVAPESNVGLRPPATVLVVDVDPRNGGLDRLAALEAAGKSLPNTATVRTGGGGLHAYYDVPPGLSWPKEVARGVDLKSATGYLVAPPSVHESGQAYAWNDASPIVPAPAWLVALGRERQAPVEVVDEDEGAAQSDEAIARVAAQLEPHFTKGRKHQIAYAFGGWARQRGWNSADAVRVIELLPSSDVKGRRTDVRDGYKANQGWHALRDALGEQEAAALDAATPNPRREREAAGMAAAGALIPPQRPAPVSALVPPPLPEFRHGVAPHQASILYDDQREHDATDAAIRALACSGTVYQRGGLLVHVARDLSPSPRSNVERPKDAPRIAEIQPPKLRDELSRHSTWFNTKSAPIAVPPRVVDGVRARDEWQGVRALRGLAEFPIVRPDGAIVAVEGYDEATGVYVAPSCDVVLSDGTSADLAGWLLDELTGDFPFGDPAHRSAWLAALLTPLARYAFDGPTPLFLVDKNVRGSGGSLLADLIGVVCTGRALPRMSQALDETEENKRLLGLAVAGDPVVLIDNVSAPLGNGALDRALTGTAIRDRWLGGNRIVTAPWNCMLVVTGNNLQLVGDTTRRALPIRLESPEERPEERSGFRHADVKRWAQQNRGRLVGAALGILAAHLRQGVTERPRPWGSFEGWSDVVRGAVMACGLPDPCNGRAELIAVDSEAETARALIDGLTALHATTTSAAKTVKELVAATAGAPLPPALEGLRDTLAMFGGGGPPDARTTHRIGNALRRYRGRVVSGRRLASAATVGGSARWYAV